MSRVPPCLLYLAIYNPTLSPEKVPGDEVDEDAEEQAHILFYTSKERAVSRDRMLRQIGLAKALVNFSELFDPHNDCETVHSQSRRMVMVSPEPNFWINASIELPKRLSQSSRSKEAASKKSKGKDKDTASSNKATAPAYDYDDGTVHDIVLQMQLLQGYEKFKLLHGSFASILAELGQEALELQLERFFTVWAWSWNLEEKPDILTTLGTSLHPYFSILIPLLDGYCSLLPEHVIPAMFINPYIIPSSRYTAEWFPIPLVQHLLSVIPPPTPPTVEENLSESVDTIRGSDPDSKSTDNGPGILDVMDVRKWNWPGYLTFGKNSSKSSSPPAQEEEAKANEEDSSPGETTPESTVASVQEDPRREESNTQVEVDPSALEDALSSDGISISSKTLRQQSAANTIKQVPSSQSGGGEAEARDDTGQSLLDPSSLGAVSSSPQSHTTISPHRPPTPPTPPPPPEFSLLRVHLASSSDPTLTRRRTIYYHIRNGMMLALLGLDETGQDGSGESEDDVLSLAAENAIELFDTVELNIQRASESKLAESLPSVTKILQPSDQFAISTGQYTVTNRGFSSNSSHLYNCRALLRRDSNILEVFSRGQNPQHWHISRRGLSTHDSPEDEAHHSSSGEMHLEVFRKEATLPDVDNVLASILRKSGVVESGLV